MILYINDEHCLSVEQLKGYFTEDLTAESPIFSDLLDYGRSGDISEWLKEMEEDEMSGKVASIDNTLSDSEYFIALKKIITGNSATTSAKTLKPSFEKCFKFEGVEREFNGNSEIKVQVNLKVLLAVNERYELSVHSSWGSRGQMINPYDYQEGEVIKTKFTFRKRPGVVWEITSIKIDDKDLPFAKERKSQKNDKETLTTNESHSQLKSSENKKEVFLETVKGVSFKMIKVEGGTFDMGAQNDNPNGKNYDLAAQPDETPVQTVTLEDYYIGQMLVTQRLWKAIMGSNPSEFIGENNPVDSVEWGDCQEFIKKMNLLTGRCYSLPTEAEWEYAARGGTKSKGYKYSGSNTIEDVAWFWNNSNKPLSIKGDNNHTSHPVGHKDSNELGLYDMCGNVREWCSDEYEEYNSSQSNNTQETIEEERSYVARGGSWKEQEQYCRVSSRDVGIGDNEQGFRLVCRL